MALHTPKPRFEDASGMMSESGAADLPLGAARVGAELRAARLRLGWKLPDVAASLRIRLPYMEAIEDGRIADLPGNAYAVGFLRAYAGMLGLDATEVARRFRAEAQEVNRKPDLQFPAPVPERGVPAGAVVLLGVLIAAGSYAAWYKFSGDHSPPPASVPAVPERLSPLADRGALPSNPSPQVASILPPPGTALAPLPLTPPATPAPAPSAATIPSATVPTPAAAAAATPSVPPAPPVPTDRMVVRAKADAWVQVRNARGPVLLSRVLRAGETWPVPTGAKLMLTTGNAGGVEIVTDGVTGPALGPSGQMKRDVPLDPDALRPLAPAAPAASTGRGKPQ